MDKTPEKAPDAFRTISEVAEVLDTPAHVLRFWESRFPQIRPVKRAGGRRYYRPADVALLAGIRHLLHDQGMTIRGVQKVLRENGVRHVQSLSRGQVGDFGEVSEVAEIEAALDAEFLSTIEPKATQPAEPMTAEVVPLPRVPRSPRVVQDMLAANPKPANAPDAAEVVPEAPFIEAEADSADIVQMPTKAEPVIGDLFGHVPVKPAPVVVVEVEGEAEPPEDVSDDLPEDPPEDISEDLADLAALDGVSVAEAESQVPAAPPAAPLSDASLAARLRALPQPLAPESAAALADLLARAKELQARLASGSRSRF